MSSDRGESGRHADPHRYLAARSDLAQVAFAISRLSEAKRAVLLLVEVEGLSSEATADALQIPLGTVWRRLHQARAELRRELRGKAWKRLACSRRWEVEAVRDGRLQGKDAESLTRHLLSCVECASEERELEALSRGVREVPVRPADELSVRRQRQGLLLAARALVRDERGAFE